MAGNRVRIESALYTKVKKVTQEKEWDILCKVDISPTSNYVSIRNLPRLS